MTTPIFDNLVWHHMFDPLEHVEYETISDRAGTVVREIAIWNPELMARNAEAIRDEITRGLNF